jgi:hypothetical protein
MELATLTLKLNHNGTDVRKTDITPAEAQVLRRMFEPLCGTNPICDLKVTGKALTSEHTGQGEDAEVESRDRTPEEEIMRLRGMYDSRLIEKMFPGENPNLPETFAKARIPVGQGWQQPVKAPESKRMSFPRSDSKEEVEQFEESLVAKM